jgi:transcriptional regulator with XRE-family HTH domain
MGTIQKQFGNRVKDLRLAKGFSQEELAFRAGMHRTYLGGIERGERNPSLKNIAAIANALDVTLRELFSLGGNQ